MFASFRLTKLVRNVRLGVKTLWLHKLRSALTMLGIVFGVGSVIAMLSVGEGASREARRQIRLLGSNNVLLESRRPEAASREDEEENVDFGLTYDDLERARLTLPSVARVVPAKTIPATGRLGDVEAELRLVGTTADWFALVPRELLAGRVLSPRDVAARSDVVVLTESGARKLLAGTATVGNRVTIGQGSYEVVGVLRTGGGDDATAGGAVSAGGGGVPTPDRDVDAYVPLSVVRARFGDMVVRFANGGYTRERVELHQVILEVADMDDVPATAEALARTLDPHHPQGDYAMTVPLELLRQAQRTKRTFNVVLGSIAGISLLVGGIGIMNIMLASVTERTREIGVRRAIGARRSQIVGQFLIETLVLTGVGGLVGTTLGAAVPVAISWYADMPTETLPWMLALAVGISVLVGVTFGLYPAIRAANLDPIQALRHE